MNIKYNCLYPQINVNKKELGQSFKKDSKAITEALETMSECDAMELKVRSFASVFLLWHIGCCSPCSAPHSVHTGVVLLHLTMVLLSAATFL